MILLWLLYILVDAYINWYIIEKKKTSPHHGIMIILRGMAAIIFGACIDTQEHQILQLVIFTGGSFWLLFDPILNLMRGKSPLYIGKTSKIDTLGNKYPKTYWILKVVILISVVVAYMKW